LKLLRYYGIVLYHYSTQLYIYWRNDRNYGATRGKTKRGRGTTGMIDTVILRYMCVRQSARLKRLLLLASRSSALRYFKAILGRIKDFLDFGKRCVLAAFFCEIFRLLLHQDLDIA